MPTAKPQRYAPPRPPRANPQRYAPPRPPRAKAISRGAARGVRAERRRRQQHFRRLRRDLLVDVAIGILLATVVLISAAGLGVVVLLEVPLAGALIGTTLARRARRRRRRAQASTSRRRAPGTASASRRRAAGRR